MTLIQIILATLAGGVLSVLAAASLSLTVLRGMAHKLVGFSVGLLLAVAFLNLLPEATEAMDGHQVGMTVLAGILIFFALEKAALWRHDHHEDSNHVCHSHTAAGSLIVLGDGMHNFVDGVLIAAAFLQDPALGWATTIAVISHEIPQEVGDFMVLLASGYSRLKALWLNLLSSLAAVLGGVIGWFALSGATGVIPYVLALAAASFIYIAVADLVPALHKHRKPLDFVVQFALLAAGIGVVLLSPHSH
ncbi:MAG: ZIP family metal transporter [Hydrogenophilaceae bacterium]|nr:ZIP family metal transporter [Hydrogenophilaceae bacterium]